MTLHICGAGGKIVKPDHKKYGIIQKGGKPTAFFCDYISEQTHLQVVAKTGYRRGLAEVFAFLRRISRRT